MATSSRLGASFGRSVGRKRSTIIEENPGGVVVTIKRTVLFVKQGENLPPITQDEWDEIDSLEAEEKAERKEEEEFLKDQKQPLRRNMLKPKGRLCGGKK
ncbi:MAG: hypothetical protein ACOYJV_01780 [Aminivibrio sp.]